MMRSRDNELAKLNEGADYCIPLRQNDGERSAGPELSSTTVIKITRGTNLSSELNQGPWGEIAQ
jgi:hypothetical protein